MYDHLHGIDSRTSTESWQAAADCLYDDDVVEPLRL
jgi:hypothetical protein